VRACVRASVCRAPQQSTAWFYSVSVCVGACVYVLRAHVRVRFRVCVSVGDSASVCACARVVVRALACSMWASLPVRVRGEGASGSFLVIES
jgi:hypothetical protein